MVLRNNVMLVNEAIEDILKPMSKQDIVDVINKHIEELDSPADFEKAIESFFKPSESSTISWDMVFIDLIWFLRKTLGPNKSNKIFREFFKDYAKYHKLTESLNESILDQYETFFDIEFSGLGINEVFEIGGNRYIIDDINLGIKENVIEFIIKGIDTREKLKLFIDSNTNKTFDIQKIMLPNYE